MKTYFALLLSLVVGSLAIETSSFAASPSTAPQKEKRIYFYQKPLQTKVSLRPVARSLHYSWIAGSAIANTFILQAATDQPWSVVGSLAAANFFWRRLPFTPINTFIHLKVLSKWKSKKALEVLDQSDEIGRVFMITSRKYKFNALQAVREEANRFIFVETLDEQPLSREENSDFGTPIELKKPEKTYIEFKLSLGNQESDVTWKVSVEDLLEKKEISEDVLEEWKKDFLAFRDEESKLSKYLTREYREDVQLRGTLHLNKKTTVDLGPILYGREIEKIIGFGIWNRFKAAVMGDASYIPLDIRKTQCGKLLSSE